MATLRDILTEHLAGLDSRIEGLRVELQALETERDNTEKMLATLPDKSAETSVPAGYRVKRALLPAFAYLTIKELALKALREKFTNGATATQMVEHFKSAWGREVMRTSLSPQLTRLKDEKKIDIRGNQWFLTNPGNEEAPAD
jgi:hypothetical protein